MLGDLRELIREWLRGEHRTYRDITHSGGLMNRALYLRLNNEAYSPVTTLRHNRSHITGNNGQHAPRDVFSTRNRASSIIHTCLRSNVPGITLPN